MQINMVMGNSENLRVFNFTILLKSRKFDAQNIHVLQYTGYPPKLTTCTFPAQYKKFL